MIVTKKAAIGFILLAVIIFSTSQYTFNQVGYSTKPEQILEKGNASVQLGEGSQVHSDIKPMVVKYQPPILSLRENAPIIITAIIELFALVCYLGLKYLEPRINRKAEEMMTGLRHDS
jgi:hypothetical protein